MVSLFQDSDAFVFAASLITDVDFAVTSADEEDLRVTRDIIILLDDFVFGSGQLDIESVDKSWQESVGAECWR
jgi:hypothetical protein